MTDKNDNKIPYRYQQSSQETLAVHIDKTVMNRPGRSVCQGIFSTFGNNRVAGLAPARMVVLCMLLILVVPQQAHSSASDRDTIAPASHALPEMKKAAPATRDETTDSTATSQPVTYYLQVGAFHEQDRAIVLKNKLSRMGFKSGIEEASVDDTGVYHRVRVGPFSDPQVHYRTKLKLYAVGFKSQTFKK